MHCRRCHRDVPWGTIFCPHCREHLRTWYVGWILYLALAGILGTVVVIWLAEFFFAPHRPPNPSELPYLAKPLAAVTQFLADRLPGASPLRLEPRGNYNLRVYLPRGSYESLSYRERRQFLKAVTQVWCENLPKAAWVPFVEIRDNQTGEELATDRCAWVR